MQIPRKRQEKKFPGDPLQADWDNSDHLRLLLFLLHPAHCGQPQRFQMMRKYLGQRKTKYVLFVVKMVHVFPALQVDRYLIIVHPTMTQISTAQVVCCLLF